MIQIFRSRLAKQVAVIVFAALMVIFLLTSVDLSAMGGAGSVGRINGRKVDVRRYESLVQQQTNAAQRQSPVPLSLEEINSIRDQVWEQLISQSVLDAEYRRYGLTVTEEEIATVLQQSPPQELLSAPDFQTDGQFDMAKYQRWLTAPSSAQSIEILGAQIREQLLRSKLLTIITGDLYLSDAALWERYRDLNEKVRISLTAIVPRNIIPDTAIAVSDAEVQAYFREHTADFSRGRVAFLSGIRLDRRLTASDSAAALERARATRAEIEAGAPFAEVARRESSDPVSAERGGELGEWVRGNFDPAFDSAAFSIPLNTISQPVLSAFGYHLIEVTARRGDTADARHILISIEVAGANRDLMDGKLDSLDRMAAGQNDPAALDSVAKYLGLRVQQAEPVQEGGRVQLGTQVVPDAGVWAFQSATGEISELIETPDAYYLFRLDSLRDDSQPTLAQVRPAVEAAVRDEKKFAAAHAVAENYLRRLAEGATPASAASALRLANTEMGPFVRVSPPLDIPEVVGAAFSIPEGTRSGIITTTQGLYVIDVLSRTPADSAAFVAGLDRFRAQVINESRQSRVRNFMQSLRDRAEVDDRRQEMLRKSAVANSSLRS